MEKHEHGHEAWKTHLTSTDQVQEIAISSVWTSTGTLTIYINMREREGGGTGGWEIISLLEGSQASPARPSGKSSRKMKQKI